MRSEPIYLVIAVRCCRRWLCLVVAVRRYGEWLYYIAVARLFCVRAYSIVATRWHGERLYSMTVEQLFRKRACSIMAARRYDERLHPIAVVRLFRKRACSIVAVRRHGEQLYYVSAARLFSELACSITDAQRYCGRPLTYHGCATVPLLINSTANGVAPFDKRHRDYACSLRAVRSMQHRAAIDGAAMTSAANQSFNRAAIMRRVYPSTNYIK